MNTNILVDLTYIYNERKSIIDIALGFYLYHAIELIVTEEKAKEIPRVCRYLKTVNNS